MTPPPAPRLPTDKARQGRTGRPVLIILLVSLALLVIIYAAVGFTWSNVAPDENIGPETPTGDTVTPPSPASGNAGAVTPPAGAPARTETGTATQATP